MKRIILFALLIPGLLILASCASLKTKCSLCCSTGGAKTCDMESAKLVVAGFTEGSGMEKAGAVEGDVIIEYDGQEVRGLPHLEDLKKSVQSSEVSVVVLRSGERVQMTIPKGPLGIYLREVAKDYEPTSDAVIIDGIGKLDWGTGMDNSFLGALYRIDEKFGTNVSYSDLVGLSGYGFRLHFFDGWCPSSPDATCGRDLGSEILTKLGYSFDAYILGRADTGEELLEISRNENELRELIVESIDNGWPVIAIDLIEVPEWGIVTGYQNGGKDLFCRTYFDKTEGYEIAKKTPWVLYVIKGKKNLDLTTEYRNSLSLAKELYDTGKFGNYFSGPTAIKAWIEALEDEGSMGSYVEQELDEVHLANWWTFYSLTSAREKAAGFLTANRERFGADPELIERLKVLYEEEVKILEQGAAFVPSPHMGMKASDWTGGQRRGQIEALEKFLAKEREVSEILAEIG